MKNRLLFILVILVAGFLLTGCWNRRDPEELAYVLAAAFDIDVESGQYHLIIQVARPMGEDGGGEGGISGGSGAFWVVSGTGRTPFEAMRNIAEVSSRELFWAHNRVVMISENLARQGIAPVLDLLERERQIRTIVSPAIVQGDIRKLMEAPFPLEDTGARGLSRQIKTIEEERSVFPIKNLTELYNILPQPGIQLFVGKVEVIVDNENENEDDNDGNGMIGPPAKIGGGAVFRGDQFVGWVDMDHVKGWQFVLGKPFKATFVIPCPDNEDSLWSMETFKARSSIIPNVNNDSISIDVIVSVQGRIQDYLCAGALEVQSEYISSIKKIAAIEVRKRIEEVISKSQEFNSDIFGFGNVIYRKHPRIWEEIEDQWDDMFPELEVNVDVSLNIRRTGLVHSPMEF